MSGIAGVLIPQGGRPLGTAELDRMAAAVGGEESGPPLLLQEGHVGLAVRGATGYDAGLASRRVGDATVGLAFFGRLVAIAGEDQGDERTGPGSGGAPLQTLLTLWLEEGPALFARLRGEFAVAIADGRDRSLHLATDRFRIQPLLTADRPDQFVFASRMAALLQAPRPLAPSIDPGALLDVVASSVISAPRTIFREVEKLPAAHRLSYRNGRVSVEPYWEADFTQADGAAPEQLREMTRAALRGAIHDRLARDRSGGFGAFLSGGVDSTTVTGLLTHDSGGPVATFSIGFSEERFNELHFARVAASAFHTRHTEYFVTPRDTEAAVLAVAEAFDEPFANASAVPTYYCAKVAREHGVTAMYAGDGGDELFAGNQRYADSRVYEPYDRIPRWIRDPILTPAITAAGKIVPHPLFVKAGKYVRRASLPAGERIVSYDFWNVVPPASFAMPDVVAAATAAHWRPAAMTIHHHDQARARTALDRHLSLDLKVTLADNDVPKVTRMCDRAGVAVRFPFLDERVVDAATRVPARLKMRGGELRTFFKDAYKDLLPEETRTKTKHGFGLPISGWLKSDPGLHAMMRDLVLSPRTVQRGYFRKDALEEVVRHHEEDATPYYGTVLWNLMVIELWHRRVLDARA